MSIRSNTFSLPMLSLQNISIENKKYPMNLTEQTSHGLLKEHIIEIGKTDPEKASLLSRKLVFLDGNQKVLDELRKEGLKVSHLVSPRLLGGGLADVAQELFSTGISLLKNGNKQEILDSKRQDKMVDAEIVIDNKTHKGTYTGEKIERIFKRYFFCFCPVYHLVASGEGVFDGGEVTYKGRFFNGLFHDHTGEAKYFIGSKIKYTGYFDKGKREGYGKLEKYSDEKGGFYTVYEGTWKNDKYLKGTIFAHDGTNLTVKDGELYSKKTTDIHNTKNTAISHINNKIFSEPEKEPLIINNPNFQKDNIKIRRLSTKDYSSLIQQKLKNPHQEFSLEDSIGLLLQCIRNGDLETNKAKGKESVIFIGNTGSGKSTTINYLYGCTMESKDPEELKIEGFENVIVVKPTQSGGSLDELMPIGHTKQSMTFMPQIETDQKNKITYMDCPGFLDNRGPEINIANAVNIKNAIKASKNVRVVMLINYHSLKADRGRGLSDMLKISSNLFGNTQNLIKNKGAILIGITNAPIDMNLEKLKKWLVADNLKSIQELSDRVFAFDPLDREIKGGWTKEQVITNIRKLKPITNHAKIFSTVLTDEDENRLVNISEKIGLRIEEQLKKTDVKVENFEQAAKQLTYLEDLSIIDHVTVERLLSRNQNRVERKIQEFTNEFSAKCSLENFNEAINLLKILKASIKFFDKSIQETIHIEKLEGHLKFCEEKKEKEKIKEQEYREQLKAANNRIEDMIKLLDEQKKSTELQLKEQKALFNKMIQEQSIQLHNELKKYDQDKQKLEQEFETRLQKKEEDLKLIEGLNQQEIEKRIAQEKTNLKIDYENQQKALEQDKLKFEKEQKALLAQRKKEQQQQNDELQQKLKKLEIQKTEQTQSKQTIYPKEAFGPKEWETHFGEVGKAPPLPKDIEQILNSPCSYFNGKKVRETHLLTLIPKTVNGQPLTLNSLGELIKSPKKGHSTKYSDYYEITQKEIGGQSVPSSYWALITKDVLPNSRSKTYAEQQALIKGPYAVPGALEIATGILMHHAQTGERLYSDSPDTYTRCQEKLSNGYRVVVGSFGSSGLSVSIYLNDVDRRLNGCGLGGLRKF